MKQRRNTFNEHLRSTLGKLQKTIFILLGCISLIIGIIGIFTPILPTVPFVLLAFFFFSRSSPRAARWLLDHHIFGPPLRDWHEHRVIRLKTRILATFLMLMSFSFLCMKSSLVLALKIGIGFVFSGIILFLWTRKLRPR